MRETLENVDGQAKVFVRPNLLRCNKPGEHRISLRPSGAYCSACNELCNVPGHRWNPGDRFTVTNKEG